MIIVPIKEGESIDKALKKLKKKFDKIGVKKEIRARQEFTKKSVIRREQLRTRNRDASLFFFIPSLRWHPLNHKP